MRRVRIVRVVLVPLALGTALGAFTIEVRRFGQRAVLVVALDARQALGPTMRRHHLQCE
jgi:hypothetical protein